MYSECDLGEWCGWSECSSSCGPGTQTRVRTCDCSSGSECTEPTEEHRECPEEEQAPCGDDKDGPTCDWTEWCGWSECTESCGDDAKRVRSRTCDCSDNACDKSIKARDCPGDSIEEEPCNQVFFSKLKKTDNLKRYFLPSVDFPNYSKLIYLNVRKNNKIYLGGSL